MKPQRQSRRHEDEAAAQRDGGLQDAPADAFGVDPGGPLSVDGVLALQRTTGNQAVTGMLARADDGATLAREAAPAESGEAAPAESGEAAAAAQELRGPQTTTGLKMTITAEVLAALGVETETGGGKEPTKPGDHKDYAYKEVKGKAFVKGAGDASDIDPYDVKQGNLADCYLLAAMIAIARKNPEAIRKLISEKADGTYDVTIYEDGWLWGKEAVVINVTPTFPHYPGGGGPAYAQKGDVEAGDPAKGESDKPELWAMLIEKAYAIHKGGYEDIGKGGSPAVAMEALTGKESKTYDVEDYSEEKLAELIEKLMMKGAVTATSRPSDKGKGDKKADKEGIVTWHIYPVKKVDAAGKTIDLQNPWGPHKDLTALPLSKFKTFFTVISFVEI